MQISPSISKWVETSNFISGGLTVVWKPILLFLKFYISYKKIKMLCVLKLHIKWLTLLAGFRLRSGRAGKKGSSSLTSLTEGTRPLSRYSPKTKPVNIGHRILVQYHKISKLCNFLEKIVTDITVKDCQVL